jgi:hypothetical protein
MRNPTTFEIVDEILRVISTQIYQTAIRRTNRHLRDLLNHVSSHRNLIARYLPPDQLRKFLYACRSCGGHSSPLPIHPSVEEHLCMLDETGDELRPFEMRIDEFVRDLAKSLIDDDNIDGNVKNINFTLDSIRRIEDLSALPETEEGDAVLALILGELLDTRLYLENATISSLLQGKLDRTLRQLQQLPLFSDPSYPNFTHKNRETLLEIRTLQDLSEAIENEDLSDDLFRYLLEWAGHYHRLYQRILKLNNPMIEQIPVATEQVIHVLEGFVVAETHGAGRRRGESVVHEAGDLYRSRRVNPDEGVFGNERYGRIVVLDGRGGSFYQNLDVPEDAIESRLRAALATADTFEDLMVLSPRIQLMLRTYFPNPRARPIL